TDARTHLLLAIQAALALLVNPELLYLLALELPLVVPLRVAPGWQAGVTLAMTGFFVTGATLLAAPPSTSDPLQHLPHVWRWTFTGGTMAAWQGFAFCAGCLAAVERRNRRELTRVNAEMSAAQQLLEHNSRLAE